MKKIFILVLISGALSIPALAQNTFSIQYSLAFGGTINDFITSTSVPPYQDKVFDFDSAFAGVYHITYRGASGRC